MEQVEGMSVEEIAGLIIGEAGSKVFPNSEGAHATLLLAPLEAVPLDN